MTNKFYYYFLFFFIVLALFVGSFLFVLFAPNSQLADFEQKTVVIKKGMDLQAIGLLLHQERIVSSQFRLQLATKLLGIGNSLKAGRYDFQGRVTNLSVLKIIHQGKVSSIRITLPEGMQSRHYAKILSRELGLDSLALTHLIQDSTFVHSLGVDAASLEGFLFPNTYYFYWGQDERSVLKRLVGHFFDQVATPLLNQMQQMKLTLVQMVTLASLIQGEAMLRSEMPIISAVFHNRLQKGMLLQADPTLQYIITDGPRRLHNSDKRIDSPYNTYLYTGLPPGPINNPSLAAIQAAVNPEPVSYLFFVANGDGTHTFSRSLREHLQAKAQFDKIRREVYQRQKLQEGVPQ